MFAEQLSHIDPMLGSLFKQAKYEGCDDTLKKITIVFGNEFSFFNEIIQKSEPLWKPILSKIFQKEMTLAVVFKLLENNKTVESKKNLSSKDDSLQNSKKKISVNR